MQYIKRLLLYLNPVSQLGSKRYSILFPFITVIVVTILLEVYVYVVRHDPNAVGTLAIFFYVALIIYFSFHDGLRGGFIAAALTILYYFYIIYSRQYKGEQLTSGINTTIVLGALYFFIAAIIGGLKQKIDTLIEREADEKKRLQTIIQQLPVGIIITDSNGTIVRTNRRVEEIFGIKLPKGYTFGKDPAAVVAKRNGRIVTSAHSVVVMALSTGKAIVGREYVVDRQDGKKVYVQASVAPIHNREGKIIAAAVIVSDVTQQKELEMRKDDFVNMASHELKTPITSMKIYTDILMSQLPQKNERTTKILSSLRGQTDRLQELISDLLDVSRIQTGKLRFDKTDFRLDELVGETIEELKGVVRNTPLVYAKKTPVTIHGDRFRVYQVITNLLTNAMKYSPSGGDIKIEVKKKEGKALLSVSDQGIGIPKSQHKKIFERLYQVTDPEQKTFPGLGMGLYISKEIVKRHKGTIWVESERKKGSKFYVSFPLRGNEF